MESNATIEALGAARQRVLHAHDRLDDLDTDVRTWALQRSLFNRAGEQYLELVRAYRQSTTSAERRSMLDTWRARLMTGWTRNGTERVILRFEQVLREYEALCDAERGREAVSGQFSGWFGAIERERERLTALRAQLQAKHQTQLECLNPTTWPEFWSAVRALPDVPGESQSAFVTWLGQPIAAQAADAWAQVRTRQTKTNEVQPLLV